MSNSVIKVQKLSKRYRLGLKEKEAETLVGQISQAILSPWENLKRLRILSRFGEDDESVFWALKDVSFEVHQGEVLGIIGKNGSGKSTLLKILSQITEPTSGKIEIHGRVASLLEVGTGFHPELSGRENIYMNGTILGMTRKEIDKKLDEIIDFSGVEKFIDTPVKFYSSGMKVRLGFSVAAHLDPEILIIDEVLAVGDFEFQAKCLGKMEDVSKNQGRTVLFVSHSMQAIQALCTSCILLENSRVKFIGSTSEVINKYVSSVSSRNVSNTWKREDVPYDKPIVFVEAKAKLNGEQPFHRLLLELKTVSTEFHENGFFALNLSSLDGTQIFQTIPQEKCFIPYSKTGYSFNVIVDLPPIIPGTYLISIWIGTHYSDTLDWKKNVLEVVIDHPPLIGRSFPYSSTNGYISPVSKIVEN